MRSADVDHALDLGRRDLLKLGIATGLALGVSPELIPGAGPRPAHARVGVNTEGIAPPTIAELRAITKQYHLHLSDDDLATFQKFAEGNFASYRRLNALPEPKLPIKAPRTAGYRPAAAENPLNAWYWRCSIKGASGGKLAGKKIAIKDNTCVAGIPMMNGSAILEGYVPDVDATVVTRILDAGGEIVGKAVNEDLCFSGASFTPATGPVLNPHDGTRNAGGSSCGSAALVASRAVDMATGGDQGGSIRIPASYSGCYGLKPTWSLVPYTGIMPIEATLDHTGPMAMTVHDVALLLEVIAGKDPLDPRQPSEIPVKPYTRSLTGNVRGLRFGVVREGFGWPGASEPDVDEAVQRAAGVFERLGATVRTVPIPMHRDGVHIWTAVAVEGALAQMVLHNGMGYNWQGYYTTSLLDYYGRARKALADSFPDTVKLVILLGAYMMEKYLGRFYAKAQNLVPVLREAYDAALREVDVLVMPTTPMKATKIPVDPSPAEYFTVALGMIQNTSPFDCTHHPALSLPCAKSQSLPVGMMLIGRQWEDDVVLRAAHAFEQTGTYVA